MDLRESYHEWFIKHTSRRTDEDDETFKVYPSYRKVNYDYPEEHREVIAYISKRRSLGGTAGSCWDDHKYTVDAAPEESWDEFYNVVESMNPNLGFGKFHREILPLIKTRESGESDYYGGYVSYETKEIELYTLWCAIYG
jgi:hypothetical protein